MEVSLSHLVLMVPCSTNSNILDNTFLLKYSYCTCRKAFFTDLPPCIFQIEYSRLTLSLKLHSIFLAGKLGLISEPAVKSPDSYGGVKTWGLPEKDRHHCNSTLGHSLWLQFVAWIEGGKDGRTRGCKRNIPGWFWQNVMNSVFESQWG